MKLRKIQKKQRPFPRISIDAASRNQAVHNFLSTYELVEMTISKLSMFEIARAQRVCRTFRDVIVFSSQIRNAVACQTWLPAVDDKGEDAYSVSLPAKTYLDFDSGLASQPDVRFFRTETILDAPTPESRSDVVAIVFQHTIGPPDESPRSGIDAWRSTLSAELWRMIPLCPPGVAVDVHLNSKHKGWSTRKRFEAGSSLADVYEWLAEVRNRRLQMGTHRKVPPSQSDF